MNKKAIILCMSCGQERYINEEEAIRQTWGKDILEGKYDNIELMFYRGGSDNTYLEGDVLHLTSDDTLIGTYQKSIDAFNYLLENKDFDYVIRTNTSTYINLCAIQQFLEFNIDEEIVCGPSIVMNQSSHFLSILGGHFLIMSKHTIKILSKYRLINERIIDDVGFGICLYKNYGKRYLNEIIKEVDNINDITLSYVENLLSSYCVRIKDEKNFKNNINNMFYFHRFYGDNKDNIKIREPHGFTKIYTIYGQIPI